MARARLRDHRRQFGHIYDLIPASSNAPKGILAGVPIAVKDNFALSGRVTRAGRLPVGASVAARSAMAVRTLQAAGADVCATTAMDELAHGFTTVNPHHPPCRNPYDRDRIAGGSSGGSAVAVAIGDVPIALGTDTNGSVRVPASLCGVFGLKPGFDVVSMEGIVPFARSLDHVGWFTRTLTEARHVLDVLAPGIPRTSVDVGRARVAAAAVDDVADPDAAALAKEVARVLGADRWFPLPWLEDAMSASLIITAVEGAETHLTMLRTQRADLGLGVRTGLTAGARLPGTAYVTAERYRARLRAELTRLFTDIDILVLPTTPVAASALSHAEIRMGDGSVRDREPYLGIFTAPFSLVGLPALSIPVATDGLPIGVQLVGAPGSEHLLLDAAAVVAERHGLIGSMAVAA